MSGIGAKIEVELHMTSVFNQNSENQFPRFLRELFLRYINSTTNA
jgi:hypothetical protein